MASNPRDILPVWGVKLVEAAPAPLPLRLRAIDGLTLSRRLATDGRQMNKICYLSELVTAPAAVDNLQDKVDGDGRALYTVQIEH